MIKLDLKRKFRHLYNPSPKQPSIVDVPEFNYLMIDGTGDPNTAQEYQDAVQALYSLAYTLKFMLKKSDLAVDYTVMALEGLWWADDMAAFTAADRGVWKWTMMIMQPEFVTPAHVRQAAAQAAEKRDLPALPRIRLAPFHEGLCAQIMHLGPYAAEAPTIAALHDFIHANGYQRRGKHHEIYLSDPRKAAPARMKTIIRQPIQQP